MTAATPSELPLGSSSKVNTIKTDLDAGSGAMRTRSAPNKKFSLNEATQQKGSTVGTRGANTPSPLSVSKQLQASSAQELLQKAINKEMTTIASTLQHSEEELKLERTSSKKVHRATKFAKKGNSLLQTAADKLGVSLDSPRANKKQDKVGSISSLLSYSSQLTGRIQKKLNDISSSKKPLSQAQMIELNLILSEAVVFFELFSSIGGRTGDGLSKIMNMQI